MAVSRCWEDRPGEAGPGPGSVAPGGEDKGPPAEAVGAGLSNSRTALGCLTPEVLLGQLLPDPQA